MVKEGQNWRCNAYTKHIQDATSLAFMSKREIYEKFINNKIKEGEMRNGSAHRIRHTEKGNSK